MGILHYQSLNMLDVQTSRQGIVIGWLRKCQLLSLEEIANDLIDGI